MDHHDKAFHTYHRGLQQYARYLNYIAFPSPNSYRIHPFIAYLGIQSQKPIPLPRDQMEC